MHTCMNRWEMMKGIGMLLIELWLSMSHVKCLFFWSVFLPICLWYYKIWSQHNRSVEIKSTQSMTKLFLFLFLNRMFDPLVHGDYPSEMRECPGLELPRFSHNEKQLLRGSIDFIGFNHYSTLYVKDCIHSACPLGGDHAIRGFLITTGYRDGVPIGEPVYRTLLLI